MSRPNIYEKLDRTREIELTVKGRKSGMGISRPVWFVIEGKTLYLLPVSGSDTKWYKNTLVNPTLKLSLNGTEILSTKGRNITDENPVRSIVRKLSPDIAKEK
jgi:hypothetical protein